MTAYFEPTSSVGEIPKPVSSYFGCDTFGIGDMRAKLSGKAYQDLVRTQTHGEQLSKETADAVAQVVKEWAVNKGVTHFCHWFQPMTGLTAEKHDAFIDIQSGFPNETTVVERFTGSMLIKGEPDASSFPSGGMRSTFEARGYTAWDPRSPLFIIQSGGTYTLCIPSVFFGYHGDSLDLKTPLLRSAESLSKNMVKLLKLLGDVDVKRVDATLGTEQEYFLIDTELANQRPDIIMTGRTLMGAPASKGHKLDDHYFGAIPERVKAYMADLEKNLYRLGIPAKTRHNEVAPGQFELAPIFENVTIAADHNTLTMETMKRVAMRHGFKCLLHEKPFAGINGNGKHANWSVASDKGYNLLEPGKTPHQNLRFLTMVCVTLKALKSHGDVLSASIMSSGNEHRLGGNEAPPTIISVFLGSLLEQVFESIEKNEAATFRDQGLINLGVSHLPQIEKDHADRNRTTPFAFTGNKFEFRAVGAATNVAIPITVLNAAVSEAALDAADKLESLLKTSSSKDEAVVALIKDLYIESRNVLFAGNNYSQEWRSLAADRGLAIIDNCRDAFLVTGNPKATEFLRDLGVLNERELLSRHVVNQKNYLTKVSIEAQTMIEMTYESIIPSLEQQFILCCDISKNIKLESVISTYNGRREKIEGCLGGLISSCDTLKSTVEKIESLDNLDKQIDMVEDGLKAQMLELRKHCDHAESIVAGDLWPIPKYRELLFHPSLANG